MHMRVWTSILVILGCVNIFWRPTVWQKFPDWKQTFIWRKKMPLTFTRWWMMQILSKKVSPIYPQFFFRQTTWWWCDLMENSDWFEHMYIIFQQYQKINWSLILIKPFVVDIDTIRTDFKETSFIADLNKLHVSQPM